MLQKMSHKLLVKMKSAWADKKYYYLLFDYALQGDFLHYLRWTSKCKFEFSSSPDILSLSQTKFYAA